MKKGLLVVALVALSGGCDRTGAAGAEPSGPASSRERPPAPPASSEAALSAVGDAPWVDPDAVPPGAKARLGSVAYRAMSETGVAALPNGNVLTWDGDWERLIEIRADGFVRRLGVIGASMAIGLDANGALVIAAADGVWRGSLLQRKRLAHVECAASAASPDGTVVACVTGEDVSITTAGGHHSIRLGTSPREVAVDTSGNVAAVVGDECLRWGPDKKVSLRVPCREVHAISMMPDGAVLTVKEDAVTVYDKGAASWRVPLPAHLGNMRTATVSSSGRYIAVLAGKHIVLLDSRERKVTAKISTAFGALVGSFSPDERRLAVAGGGVASFEVPSGRVVFAPKEPHDEVRTLAFSPSGSVVYGQREELVEAFGLDGKRLGATKANASIQSTVVGLSESEVLVASDVGLSVVDPIAQKVKCTADVSARWAFRAPGAGPIALVGSMDDERFEGAVTFVDRCRTVSRLLYKGHVRPNSFDARTGRLTLSEGDGERATVVDVPKRAKAGAGSIEAPPPPWAVRFGIRCDAEVDGGNCKYPGDGRSVYDLIEGSDAHLVLVEGERGETRIASEELVVVDAKSGKLRKRIVLPRGAFRDFVLSPDGRTLAVPQRESIVLYDLRGS